MLSGVPLAGGVVLLLPATPDVEDLAEIESAARPLLELLAARGLLTADRAAAPAAPAPVTAVPATPATTDLVANDGSHVNPGSVNHPDAGRNPNDRNQRNSNPRNANDRNADDHNADDHNADHERERRDDDR
jgi:hypothetical protein